MPPFVSSLTFDALVVVDVRALFVGAPTDNLTRLQFAHANGTLAHVIGAANRSSSRLAAATFIVDIVIVGRHGLFARRTGRAAAR